MPGRRGRPGQCLRTRRHGEEVGRLKQRRWTRRDGRPSPTPAGKGAGEPGEMAGTGRRRNGRRTGRCRDAAGSGVQVQRSGSPCRGEVSHEAAPDGGPRRRAPGGVDGRPERGGEPRSRTEAAGEDRPRVAHGPPKTGQPGQRGTQGHSLPPANQASRQNGVLTVGEVTGRRRSSRH